MENVVNSVVCEVLHVQSVDRVLSYLNIQQLYNAYDRRVLYESHYGQEYGLVLLNHVHCPRDAIAA